MTASACCYAAGYTTGALVFMWVARLRRIHSLTAFSLLTVGLLGGLATAGLAQRLVVGGDGKTVLGGLVGGYASVMLYKRAIGLARPTGDLFAVSLCAGEAVGRWGCFFGGCCYGKPTSAPWAVWQHGAWRHPTQIYLSITCSLILVVLWLLARRAPRENLLFFAQGALYCAARFIVEFWRASPSVALALTAAQWACIVGMTYFAARLWALNAAPRTRPAIATSDDYQSVFADGAVP